MIFAVNASDGTLKLAGNALTGTGTDSGANWIAFDSTGKYAYVTNNKQGSVSQFIVDAKSGMLTRNGDDVTVGAAPIQVAVDPTDRFVYVANSGDNTVSQLRIRHDGSLSPGAVVRMHGQAETHVGGALHLPGSPWTIAFARR
jgi:6-phosphogluconolactonase (cycloisomerase 2 family)